mmetsp:Transcript_96280/g.176167  ORF Transcript_96280/g.176167 Transcript_96280/m.176167 type:complete len:486 (+) Transcript_96280:94-1551(+)
MAGVVLPDLKACAPDFYFLNLAGTDRFSWRLRSEPCMNADEIAEFYHGDRIKAVRDVCHPGWLKLVDKPGWVKEAHEEQLVWKTAQSQPSSQVMDLEPSSGGCKDAKLAGKDASKCSAGVSEGRDASKCSAKLSAEDISDISPSSACSNGSRTSPCPTAHAHALSPALPRFFTGKSCSIGDGENSHAVVTGNIVPTRWFTGQSCKIDLMPFERSSTMDKKPAMRPRWADMEDTDEEDSGGTPRFCKKLTERSFAENRQYTHLGRMPCFDLPIQDTVENTPDADTVNTIAADAKCGVRLDDMHHDAQLVSEFSINEQIVLKPKRHQRNRDLLQRKNKTQMCQYLAKTGSCPFGSSCWFAHSACELKEQGNVEKKMPCFDLPNQDTVENTPKVDTFDQIAADEERGARLDKHHDAQISNGFSINERVVLKPKRHKRNQDLLHQKNKTQMCQYMAKEGSCPFGDKCWFAHAASDLKGDFAIASGKSPK